MKFILELPAEDTVLGRAEVQHAIRQDLKRAAHLYHRVTVQSITDAEYEQVMQARQRTAALTRKASHAKG